MDIPHVYNRSFAPIPARSMPFAWEDLASLVSRVAGCMGYRNPQWVVQPEENSSTIQPFNLCMLRERKDYQFLEQLLQLDEEMLYSLSLHRFTRCIQVPESLDSEHPAEIQRPLLSRHIFQTFFRPYSATAVCSICLAEEPTYGRLYQNVLPVVACLQHDVFLTHQCPHCLCPIPLLRSSLTHCPRCKTGDYREAPIVPAWENVYFQDGQAILLNYLGIDDVANVGNVVSREKDTSPLLSLLPWQYFQLLDAFRCIFGPLFPHAPFLQGSPEVLALLRQHSRPNSTLSSIEWSVVVATFHWLFLLWPNNFFAFLNAFPHVKSSRVRKRDQERATGVQRDFGVLYEKWLYKRLTHPSFVFLHEAFEDYLRVYYTTGEITSRLLPFKGKPEEQLQERPYLTKVQARALLGIGEDVLQMLLRQGSLRAIKKPIGVAMKRNMFLIEKASVVALQQTRRELISLDILAQIHLGTTKAIVLALEDVGMLVPTCGPSSGRYKQRFYNLAVVEQFKQTILLHVTKQCGVSVEAMVSLPLFASKAGMSLVTLLKEIFDGHLSPIEINEGQPLFQRLVLNKGEIGCFLEVYKRRQREKLGLLTPNEVAVELRMSERVLRRWVQWGLINGEMLSIGGKKPTLLFPKTALEDFHYRYISTGEVVLLLGVSLFTVSKYVRKGKLHSIIGRKTQYGGTQLLFLREKVMDMRYQGRKRGAV